MSYTYPYARPAVTVDCVLFGRAPEGRHILLIERKNPPFAQHWALPGGFLDLGESPEDGAARELAEETGLTGIPLTQLGAFGAPDRDPREHVISIAHTATVSVADHHPVAADDAADVRWFPLDDLPPLAFDHEEIIRMASQQAD